MREIILPVTCNQLKWIALIGFPIATIVGFINDPKVLGNFVFMFGLSFTTISWSIQILWWLFDRFEIKCKCDKK